MATGIDIIRRVFTDEGTCLEIGPWPDNPEDIIELRTMDAKSIEWFGRLSITMSPEFARILGNALITSALEMEIQKS